MDFMHPHGKATQRGKFCIMQTKIHIYLNCKFVIHRIICGLTSFTKRHHIIRAALESICFQTNDILEEIESSLGSKQRKLSVDGPVAANSLLMQLQADLSGLSVCKLS